MGVFLAGSFLNKISNALHSFTDNLASGWLLFGDAGDVLLALLDVLVTTAVVYFILKLMSDSRAWQLLKGLIFIVLFTVACRLFGLQTLNFILANSLSVLAIGFVVLFQPELRRALETVGRKSLRFLNLLKSSGSDHVDADLSVQNEIESIVIACERMAAVKTGALIILERRTKLGELIQGTAVIIDAAITSTCIEQIFYKGSPLHDGAALIRGDRVYATRCHVPLSDTYHMRRDYGTRHRAAVGASEIGDAVAIVVSEERGKISLAVGGRLYPMENGDSLRVALYKLLSRQESNGRRNGLRGLFHQVVAEQTETTVDGLAIPDVKESAPRRRSRFFLKVASFFIAAGLWAYVQTSVNPIQSTYLQNVPIQVWGLQQLNDAGFEYLNKDSANTVNLRFQVRAKNADRINNSSVRVSVDFSKLDYASLNKADEFSTSGKTVKLALNVEVEGLGESAYSIVSRDPAEIMAFLQKIQN